LSPDSFRQAAGKLVSRASAEVLGQVGHLVVAVDGPRVAAVTVGTGKKATLVEWSRLSGFGADAVMVGDDEAVRPPTNDQEQRAADGKLEVLGRRALTDAGHLLGVVDDVTFDPLTGVLIEIVVGEQRVPASAFRGAGSYAVVLAADRTPG